MTLPTSITSTALFGGLLALLGLPENFLSLPTWGKVAAALVAIAGLIGTAFRTSTHNPDGTPASQEWKG